MAYKKNVDDMREAVFGFNKLLEARGAKVDYHDTYVPVIPHTRGIVRLLRRASR